MLAKQTVQKNTGLVGYTGVKDKKGRLAKKG
jgi:hypothetical protein